MSSNGGITRLDFAEDSCEGMFLTSFEGEVPNDQYFTQTGSYFIELTVYDENGGMELRGVLDERLARRESICLLRREGVDARADYDALCKASDADPIVCAVELQLAKLYAFDPPHVTALSFEAAASTAVSSWLLRHAREAGDDVVGGSTGHAQLTSSDGVRIASHQLPIRLDFRDRSPEEVLAEVDRVVQR